MSSTISQEKFLSNDKNKQRLINMLCVKLQKEVFVVNQAQEMLIKSALEIEKGHNSENIFFSKPKIAAASEHSLRAYLQVQLWSGFAKSKGLLANPLQSWGWKETKHGLFPVTTQKEPAPSLCDIVQMSKRA
ncbi:hypothetical protein AVEN_218702-1 [Araneus ventricosus]|uniref:Uncharacterized protein n=1 Tax=Araneus ventricosus TaxID=182803 RepID=A0A4Y2B4Q6_ARAVE|nr:hypothetical protein AVEN_218702-1 [Araneus ventricosus]